ncbi:vWA domain-containing protein [Polyangium aurulentum]|uniref:vWA domain-containing protein n=1 Tax=Polyangium aurulentum TaxID=2567896 RepID=UPI0010AE6979|nr:hypothetical protein [Polyangium aurulentum]UQA61923.1 hypothetical protein E8A73_016205 [Polyangium aurulentum]
MYSGYHSSRFGQVACAAVLAGAVFAACSATGGPNQFTSGGEGGSGADGSGSSGPGGPGSGGEGGSLFPSGPGATGVGGGSCAATSNKAEQVPLDMYVMFDQSGSMTTSTGNGTRWQAVTGAFKSFVQQPSAAGIGVGVQYFPLEPSVVGMCPAKCASQADCNPCGGVCFPILNTCIAGDGDSCSAADYAKPDVEIAPLPGASPAIIQSLDSHTPTGGTPTYAALDGTIQHAKEWAIAHPDHVVIAVLATDGEPGSCETNLSAINALAAAGASGVPKIATYVIGVGSELAALNGIAQAGGTGQAFLVDSNQNASEQFLQAMNEIRGAALSCSYLIPQPPPGEKIDYNAINVQYTPDGGMPQIIPQVKSKAECPPDGLAWFYDEPVMPKQIILCDATCGKISQDAKAKLDVLVGCATVVK